MTLPDLVLYCLLAGLPASVAAVELGSCDPPLMEETR